MNWISGSNLAASTKFCSRLASVAIMTFASLFFKVVITSTAVSAVAVVVVTGTLFARQASFAAFIIDFS